MKNRLKEIRRHNKLSQTAFGKEVGVTLSSVQKWESGENAPTSPVRFVICDKFNINRTWLETGEGEMFRNQETDGLLPALQNILADCPAIAKALKRAMEVMTKQDFARLNEIVDQCMNENERP